MRWLCLGCERSAETNGKLPLECVCGVLDGWTLLAAGPDEQERAVQAKSLVEADRGAEAARIRSGSAKLDRLLVGGWELGCSVVLYGPGGAGKSRLAYRWAAAAGPVLVVGLEMTRAQTRAAALEAGARLSRLFYWPKPDGWQEQARARRARVVVIDSISELERGALAELLALRSWARQRSGLGLAIAHVNKRGRILGPSKIEHRCDALVQITPVGPSSARVRVRKSRFCPRGSVELELGA